MVEDSMPSALNSVHGVKNEQTAERSMKMLLTARAGELRKLATLLDQVSAFYLTPTVATIKVLFNAGLSAREISDLIPYPRPKVHYWLGKLNLGFRLNESHQWLMICPHCSKAPHTRGVHGRFYTKNARFCLNCGRKLQPPPGRRMIYDAHSELIGPHAKWTGARKEALNMPAPIQQ